MNQDYQDIVRQATGAQAIFHIEDIQTLWSGYGKIMRYGLKGADIEQLIIKHVKLPDQSHHPRGWNTDRSHQRKIKSYQVESAWYRDWSQQCDDHCRVPACFALQSDADEFLIALEDLDASGYPVRKHTVTLSEMQVCLNWLANFHATFMDQTPTGLWETGTYWHLATRPDELDALDDVQLKNAAVEIDQRLRDARYQTFVHGDAKLANFCFAEAGHQVAAVDFQYVGGGCGMKDVAYFIGSCLHEADCERYESLLLNEYFSALGDALRMRNSGNNVEAVEQEWRALYPLAWADFHRFIKGWSPGHWKIHGYSEKIVRQVLRTLQEKVS
jgi:hypothetical protein